MEPPSARGVTSAKGERRTRHVRPESRETTTAAFTWPTIRLARRASNAEGRRSTSRGVYHSTGQPGSDDSKYDLALATKIAALDPPPHREIGDDSALWEEDITVRVTRGRST